MTAIALEFQPHAALPLGYVATCYLGLPFEVHILDLVGGPAASAVDLAFRDVPEHEREERPIELMIEIVRRTQRNVKRWRSGEMGLRWTVADMLQAERQLRRVIGHRELSRLVFALGHGLNPTEEVAMVAA